MAKESVALVRPLRDAGKCVETLCAKILGARIFSARIFSARIFSARIFGANILGRYLQSANAQAQVAQWRCGWLVACCIFSLLSRPRQQHKQRLHKQPAPATL